MKFVFSGFMMLIMSQIVFAEKDLGQRTVQKYCVVCHSANHSKAINAPAAFDKEAWDKRFKQAAIEAKKKPKQFKTALDYLVYRVTIGKGLMTHGGLCQASGDPQNDCSKEALSKAILYMSQ